MEQQPGQSGSLPPSVPIDAGVGAGALESPLARGISTAPGWIGLGAAVGGGRARGIGWPGVAVGNGCA